LEERIRTNEVVRIGLAAIAIVTSAWTADARNSAAQELASIRATKAGVDARNNFWAWDATRRTVTRITPNGDRFESDILPEAVAADADQERGIAVLSEKSRVISIFDWSGTQKRSIHLLHPATDVTWLGGKDDVAPEEGSPFRPLYDDKVKFSGQPIALVLAEEWEVARYAASLRPSTSRNRHVRRVSR